MSDVKQRLQEVSESLREILDRLTFVGGGVTELLLTNPAGRKVRLTQDLDCIIEVASRVEFHQIESRLRAAGYRNDPNIPPVICRWVKDSLILDVMPTLEEILGFTNAWYKDAVLYPIPHMLPNGVKVNIIHPVYFLATKTEAFKSRGQQEYRYSQDFEDIVALVNGREELVEEMRNADPRVKNAMREYWLPKLDTVDLVVATREHIDAFEDVERTPLVISRFKKMLQ